MCRLLILIVFILYTSAHQLSFPDDISDNDIAIEENLNPKKPVQYFINGEPLWVLNLSNDWYDAKLRLGNSAEMEDFYDYVSPMIQDSRRRPRPKQTTQPRDEPQKSPYEIKRDLLKMINKFALTTRDEPDSYISGNNLDNNPTIALYFKGSYTSLMVESEGKQWHYYINSQSSLPEWFYQQHNTKDSPIQIPEDIQNKLYKSLLRLVHVLFGFPL